MNVHLADRDNLEISCYISHSRHDKADAYGCSDFVYPYSCSQRIAECIQQAHGAFTAKSTIFGWPEKNLLIISKAGSQLITNKLATGLRTLTEAEWRSVGTAVSFPERLAWLGCPPWIWAKVHAIGPIGVGGIRSCFLCLESEARFLLEQYLNDSFTVNTRRFLSEIREQKEKT